MQILVLRTTRLLPVLLVALLAGGFSASSASAVSIVDIIFTNTTGFGAVGSNSIDALPGDVITAELRLTS
ncbi:MAG: hypothetical protein JRH19_26055, partial [Deltaproteobacteria bacterium]|nr:hypothetical protein [Deltaproteobacteria bacterium]